MLNSTRAVVAAACLIAALVVTAAARPAQAAIETDPQALYQTMQRAFETGNIEGWTFRNWQYYFSTVLATGRSYSLFRKDDPQYREVTALTVTVATKLKYDPLSNSDASVWFVREAALQQSQSGAPDVAEQAKALLARLETVEQTNDALAQVADADASDNAKDYPHDPDARALQVETDLRAYVLTRDAQYRSLALARAAVGDFPLAYLPEAASTVLFEQANSAVANVAGFSSTDIANAQELLRRRASDPNLQVIATIKAVPHELHMTMTAPADEYFGRLKMSVLGIHNELKRINAYLDAGWGERMTNAAGDLCDSVNELHRIYPRDSELPQLLLSAYQTTERIDSAEAKTSAREMRTILTIEYADSGQARELLASSRAS